MDQQSDLARRKTLILSAILGIYCVLLLIVPPMAVRHGLRAVWIVLPQLVVAAILMVSLMIALKNFWVLKKTWGANGLQ